MAAVALFMVGRLAKFNDIFTSTVPTINNFSNHALKINCLTLFVQLKIQNNILFLYTTHLGIQQQYQTFVMLTLPLPHRFQQISSVDATGAALDEVAPHASEEGVEMDTTQWHRYRIVRDAGEMQVYIDGQLKLQRSVLGIESRLVRFGSKLKTVSHWRSVSAKVNNPDDYSIDWRWHARDGYPDQFRRDRLVVMDYSSDSGYSNWTQMSDGTIVISDYTNDNFIR